MPVIVEAPHAGLGLDAECLATLSAPARSIARDADLYVDRLVSSCNALGATVLVAHMSRYYLDLNRAPEDYDGLAVDGGRGRDAPHGLVWHRTTDGERAVEAPVSRGELKRRMDRLYHPYHQTLSQLIQQVYTVFGYAVILCAHSMPSMGRNALGLEEARADVVPGTRGQSSAARAYIQAVERVTREHGLTLRHDDPYRGGFTTGHYSDPRRGIHTVQIEISRRLYMNESTLAAIEPGMSRMTAYYCAIVNAFGSILPPK